MSALIILQQMTVIALLVSVGVFLFRKGIVDNTTSKKLSTIVVDVCNPALILSSILSGNMTAGHKELIVAVAVGVIFYIILIILGLIIPRLLRVDPDKRRFYNMMTVYTNIGFIGIPVAQAVLPSNAMLYVIVCNVMYSLLFYTHGITTLSAGKEKMDIKKVLSPGTIMAVLSLVVFWFNIQPPLIIRNTVTYLGNATVFLSMTLLGVSIARSKLIDGIKDFRIWLYIVIRMIIVPVVIVLVTRLTTGDATMAMALCLISSMPVGNLPLIQAEKTGEDTTILSSAIAVTTVVSLLTTTGLMALFSAV